ncbi:MAG TPA: hypothetical protein VMP67_05515 [Candidatus Limnocylindria bacterium]|nr:hypothetical protein [Candidatus Limnocylindria bacterium]
MRGTELLVPAVMASRLRHADEARLAKVAFVATAAPVRKDPCEGSTNPDCLGTLKPVNRPA